MLLESDPGDSDWGIIYSSLLQTFTYDYSSLALCYENFNLLIQSWVVDKIWTHYSILELLF